LAEIQLNIRNKSVKSVKYAVINYFSPLKINLHHEFDTSFI